MSFWLLFSFLTSLAETNLAFKGATREKFGEVDFEVLIEVGRII